MRFRTFQVARPSWNMTWMWGTLLLYVSIRVNAKKREEKKSEVAYLLQNDMAKPSNSSWSSTCILVPKPDGTSRLCTDFRRVNAVTKLDYFPLLRLDDCISN